MSAVADPQVQASDPRASAFVAANAGSGKTSTLVKRVARLLLAGARPEAILCVTYTKAGAAEMQRRLFQDLGKWAVMPDPELVEALAAIDEQGRDLSAARALFARALETPGGLKIQTLHAFCEKLLRRFPLEAGVSPGFTVLEDQAAAEVSAKARDDVALVDMANPDGPVGRAYAHFSVELDFEAFNRMFAGFEANRAAIKAYVDRCDARDGFGSDVWRRCGFAAPTSRAAIEADAMGRIRWGQWSRAARALLKSTAVSDGSRGEAMKAVTAASPFADVAAVFLTLAGTPRTRMGTRAVDPATLEWLADEQARHVKTRALLTAAAVAADTVHALTLAVAYAGLYEGAKTGRGGLDFGDLIAQAHRLLTIKADAAWVLYKLDGGLEHVLLDEGQDTAPAQWDILRALTAEFFTGSGAGPAGRTLFAVADEKQSIFSFQGAAPERFAAEKQAFGATVQAAGERFLEVALMESWRSAPEILTFVDTVFKPEEALAGIRPSAEGVVPFPLSHTPTRGPGGWVELWPLEITEPAEEDDPWAPVDQAPPESAARKLARRVARSIRLMIEAGVGVGEKGAAGSRPCAFGDVLILVRRRGALFHEIIRALKREGVPVGGADRLKLSDHGLYDDLMALARFARFPSDDLTLACLLRGPFCEVDEEGLFDLAHGRQGSLWKALGARAGERPAWGAAAAFLGWARHEAARVPPFDFFSRALGRLDGHGRSMRQRLLTRMGTEGEDALDAFLAQALAAEDRDVRDLESFIAAMAGSEIEVKREQEEGRGRGGGEVRVMTVHGAKGLEAPIVILPDTTTRATDRGGPLLDAEAGGFLWAPRGADDCPASSEARARRATAVERESARLLYVALTRARDGLIVCGVASRPHLHERSWYDYAQRAFDTLPTRAFALDGGGEGRRFGADPAPAPEALAEAPRHADLPAWTHGLAPAEPGMARYAAPSSLGEESRGAAPSPLAAVGGLGRWRRGDLIHRLLQLLPDIAPRAREAGARRLLGREPGLDDDQRAEMATAALAVLNEPKFSAVFGPGSRAEVSLAGAADRLPAGLAISGRVDRLVVEAGRVLVVDFKTNRPAPARIEDADPAYILQMAIYAAVLAEIFPGRTIEAALVWTDGPKLMAVPEGVMGKALRALAGQT
ncbi:MAG: double-strand break repair helicase AddA [Caulobacteraceae bacterium]